MRSYSFQIYKNMKSLTFLFLLCVAPILLLAQMPDQQTFLNYTLASIPEFRECLSLSNDAHFPADIEKNVQWCETKFAQRGFTSQRLDTETVPLLLVSKTSKKKNAKTVLVYLQMDGQPVDSTHWFQANPYTAVLKAEGKEGGWEAIDWSKMNPKEVNMDWRIFARSTSDAKGPVVAFLTAMDLMAENKEQLDFNVKVILDFEEELGSPHLPDAVIKYKEELAADMLIIFDGPMHISNKPTLTFGARGISTITLKVFGPLFPQHSGHYGNYVPNPGVRLSHLIASMKDDFGRVVIPGFYDGITLSEKVKATLAAVPDDEKYMNGRIGIGEPDKVADTYQQALQYPSLNVRGMLSGWVGAEVRTIIPSSATAEIDIRTVLESDPARLIELVRGQIASHDYLILDRKPTALERAKNDRICSFKAKTSYQAFRTEFDSEVGVWLDKALVKAYGESPIKIRTAGGSIPISPFVNSLNVPAVSVPTVNRDNNQHSPNENIRLGNYLNAVKTIYAIMTEPL